MQPRRGDSGTGKVRGVVGRGLIHCGFKGKGPSIVLKVLVMLN